LFTVYRGVGREADLVFSVPLKVFPKMKLEFFVLLEHKSSHDKHLFSQFEIPGFNPGAYYPAKGLSPAGYSCCVLSWKRACKMGEVFAGRGF